MAQVDHKGFSERIVSAPVSPLGQKLYVKTKDATSVALPTTHDRGRAARRSCPENQEQKVHPLYDYAFVTDREEGLVVVGPLHTLLDGDPRNNFVKRVATFNPDGVLAGATSAAIAGTTGFVTTPRGLVVLDLQDPLHPRVIGQVGAPAARAARGGRAVPLRVRARRGGPQGRGHHRARQAAGGGGRARAPRARARALPGAHLRLRGGRAARAWPSWTSSVPSGRASTRPSTPAGAINDAHDVKLGATNGSIFAYVADGKNGLRVIDVDLRQRHAGRLRLQPEADAEAGGHVPHARARGGPLARRGPRPRGGRDRATRSASSAGAGARPLNGEEQRRMYLRDGKPFTVTDAPPGRPVGGAATDNATSLAPRRPPAVGEKR